MPPEGSVVMTIVEVAGKLDGVRVTVGPGVNVTVPELDTVVVPPP